MNMYYKFFVVFLVIVVAGCDYMDTKIDTGVTRENLESDFARIERLGYSPYTFLAPCNNGFNRLDGNIAAVITDEAVQTASLTNTQYFTNGSWNAFVNPLNVYANHYGGIRAANFFLDYSTEYKKLLSVNRDTVSDRSRSYNQDVEKIQWMRAEANVLIAWLYFDLIKRYGGVPIVDRVMDINDDLDLPRASFNEVMEYIVSKIDQNWDKLQANWKARDALSDGKLTMGAALAIKSRALLYAASPLYNETGDVQKWKDAAKAANDVIQLKARTWANVGGDLGTTTITNNPAYSLSNNYRTLFQEGNSVNDNEVIWAFRLGATNDMEVNNYPIGTPGGKSGVTPSHNLVEAYEKLSDWDEVYPYEKRDPRMDASIVTNNSNWNVRKIDISQGGQDSQDSQNASRTGYYLKKFLVDNLDIEHDETKNRNWIVFRYAEILLNYAEAMNEAYGPDDDPEGYGMTARQAVNLVRGRTGVGMPNVIAGDQAEMRDKIKHERRIELAFEDHRYWDLRRWKDGAELSKPIKGVRATKYNDVFLYTESVVENRVFETPKMYFFPIPDWEIRKSKGIMVQNPGWE